MNKTITTHYEKNAGEVAIVFSSQDGALYGPIRVKIGGAYMSLSREDFHNLLACTDTVREEIKGIK